MSFGFKYAKGKERTLVAVNSQMIEHIWTNDWLNSLNDFRVWICLKETSSKSIIYVLIEDFEKFWVQFKYTVFLNKVNDCDLKKNL